MLEPIKGSYYRKFQPQSYKENDSKAKIAIIKHRLRIPCFLENDVFRGKYNG